MEFAYPVRAKADPEGGFVITCRDLPEAITQADNRHDIAEEAAGALQAAIEARIEDGLDIPVASPPRRGELVVAVPLTTALKAALHVAVHEAGLSKIELARRLGIDEKEARRMLSPGHATKAPTLERALAKLGKRAVVDLRST